MANLGALAEGAYAGYLGYQNEDDYLRRKARLQTVQGREDELYSEGREDRAVRRLRDTETYEHNKKLTARSDEILDVSLAEFKDARGVREADRKVAAEAAAGYDAQQLAASQSPLATASASQSMPTERQSRTPVPAKSRAQTVADARAANLEKLGHYDDAAKLKSNTLRGELADRELEFQYKFADKLEKLRAKKITADELKGDADLAELDLGLVKLQKQALGQAYQLLKTGDKKGFLDWYAKSKIVSPGEQADDVKQSEDGQYMLLLKGGKIIRAVPIAELEAMSTTHFTMKEGERRFSTDARGKVTETIPAAQSQDKALSQRNARHDNVRQSLDAMLFKGGGAFADIDAEKQELRRIAGPMAEKLADQGMPEEEAAAKAVAMAKDQRAREKSGAGTTGGDASSGIDYSLFR